MNIGRLSLKHQRSYNALGTWVWRARWKRRWERTKVAVSIAAVCAHKNASVEGGPRGLICPAVRTQWGRLCYRHWNDTGLHCITSSALANYQLLQLYKETWVWEMSPSLHTTCIVRKLQFFTGWESLFGLTLNVWRKNFNFSSYFFEKKRLFQQKFFLWVAFILFFSWKTGIGFSRSRSI